MSYAKKKIRVDYQMNIDEPTVLPVEDYINYLRKQKKKIIKLHPNMVEYDISLTIEAEESWGDAVIFAELRLRGERMETDEEFELRKKRSISAIVAARQRKKTEERMKERAEREKWEYLKAKYGE